MTELKFDVPSLDYVSFQDFVKTTTNVPSTFVDEFFEIVQNEDEHAGDFYIDAKQVAKWMNMRIDSLKRFLEKTFVKNKDYKITKAKKDPNTPGATGENIFMTCNCFKVTCVMMRGEKAAETRLYYFEMEVILKKYYKQIVAYLEGRVRKVLYNQRPKLNPRGGVIYFFESPDSPSKEAVMAMNKKVRAHVKWLKLGMAKNRDNRDGDQNNPLADDVNILFMLECENIDAVEKCVKAIIGRYSYRGYGKECYVIEEDLLKEIIFSCNCTNMLIKKWERKNPKTKKVIMKIRRNTKAEEEKSEHEKEDEEVEIDDVAVAVADESEEMDPDELEEESFDLPLNDEHCSEEEPVRRFGCSSKETFAGLIKLAEVRERRESESC